MIRREEKEEKIKVKEGFVVTQLFDNGRLYVSFSTKKSNRM